MQLLMLKQLVTLHIGPIGLSIDAGECVALHGPSGAGKSLLLRAIADLDPHEGSVLFNHKEQGEYAPSTWRKSVAYCAAESQWWGEQVVDHFPQVNPQTHQQLAACGFALEVLQWSVDRLSSGEKQRLSIIRQLSHTPSILLLDEPTANLDPDSAQRLEKMLLDYQQQHGAGLIWVSHDRLQRERVSRRQLLLNNGKITEEHAHAPE